MSGESPASVLYSSDGYELAVVSGSPIIPGTRALLISGTTPNGNTSYNPASWHGALGSAEMSNDFVVQANATISATGSTLVTANYFGTQEIAIIVNVGTVTGAGSIVYTIQEVDPGDGVTVFGNSASTISISGGNAPGVFTAVLTTSTSSMVKVSWVVTGTFSAPIYTTVVTKNTPSTQVISGSITATNNSVGTDGAAALGFDTQVGGKVTTAAPTYTTGNLDALSLTTLGGLRIDGVYAAGTANATAADLMANGGYVTTAAPTYTTGQLNALSLTTAGSLRVDGGTGTFNSSAVGTDAAAALGFDVQVGGKVTTAAPTYTNGNLDALSLTTLGGLRIDGVYASGTANATAADLMANGGYVTTAAPTYTTGQLSALSLDTSGNLRVTGGTGTFNSQSVGGDAATALAFDTQVGGVTSTAAPTYTTGNLDALSLTTLGGLRIDGVYAAGTANATAADLMANGGYVTTAAPTYTTGQLNALSLTTGGSLRVDASGATLSVTTNKAATAAVTSVASSATNVTLLSANANRIFAAIYNDSTKKAYIKLGTTASTSSFTIQLMPNSYWEIPVDYTGRVDALWQAANGNAVITELTP